MPRLFGSSILIAFCVVLSGCVSTQDRINRASEAEAQGRWADAAGDYIRVLKDDSSLADARTSLMDVGGRAVTDFWEAAASADAAGEYGMALGLLSRLSTLQSEANSVGVALEAPGEVGPLYAAIQGRQLEDMISRARADAAAGRLAQAVSGFDRAMNAPGMDAGRRRTLTGEKASVQLEQANQLIDNNQAQAAWDQAGRAYETAAGVNSELAAAARAVQRDAVAYGTRSIAITPLWQTRGFRAVAGDLFRQDLNDEIMFSEEPPEPLFLAVLASDEVRRVIRSGRMDRQILSRTDLRSLGLDLEVEFIVGGELLVLNEAETVAEERRVPARTRGSSRADTAYVIQTVSMAIGVRAAFRLVDVATGDIVEEHEVPAASTGTFQRGVYPGDYRDLDLSGAQQRLFDEREIEDAIIDLEREIGRALARQIRLAVFEAALKYVP